MLGWLGRDQGSSSDRGLEEASLEGALPGCMGAAQKSSSDASLGSEVVEGPAYHPRGAASSEAVSHASLCWLRWLSCLLHMRRTFQHTHIITMIATGDVHGVATPFAFLKSSAACESWCNVSLGHNSFMMQ